MIRYVLQGSCVNKEDTMLVTYNHKNVWLYADVRDAAYKGAQEMIEHFPTSEGYCNHTYTITPVQEVE